MAAQIALFSFAESRRYFDAVFRHDTRYNPTDAEPHNVDDALREKQRAREIQDARCQAFFEAMLEPPRRRSGRG